MMCNDYRNTKYCPSFGDINKKKTEFETEFRKVHPWAENVYRIVSENSNPLKIEFMKIYNCKCIYCGVSIDLIQKTSFEIDHIISKGNFPSETKAGHLDNLALACHNCNHEKSDLMIDKGIIDPDNNLNELFYRDDLFNVCVNSDFLDNDDVVKFYDQLRLGETLHRLDYIIMNMRGVQMALNDKYGQSLDSIDKAISIMVRKRNLIS